MAGCGLGRLFGLEVVVVAEGGAVAALGCHGRVGLRVIAREIEGGGARGAGRGVGGRGGGGRGDA